jgi:hypothetical protein
MEHGPTTRASLESLPERMFCIAFLLSDTFFLTKGQAGISFSISLGDGISSDIYMLF